MPFESVCVCEYVLAIKWNYMQLSLRNVNGKVKKKVKQWREGGGGHATLNYEYYEHS